MNGNAPADLVDAAITAVGNLEAELANKIRRKRTELRDLLRERNRLVACTRRLFTDEPMEEDDV